MASRSIVAGVVADFPTREMSAVGDVIAANLADSELMKDAPCCSAAAYLKTLLYFPAPRWWRFKIAYSSFVALRKMSLPQLMTVQK
jgi:hypothetical protein